MSTSGNTCYIVPELCISCGACAAECPLGAIEECDECDPETYVIDSDMCNCCIEIADGPRCLDACPLEKEAVKCENCGY